MFTIVDGLALPTPYFEIAADWFSHAGSLTSAALGLFCGWTTHSQPTLLYTKSHHRQYEPQAWSLNL